MKKNNHYEQAFEAYIQFLGLPYIATQERQRSLLPENPDDSLKNFDFIVSTTHIFPPDSWSSIDGKDYVKFFGSPASFLPSIGKCSSDKAAPSVNTGQTPEIYYPSRALSWLIDIKGRRFPSGRKQPQYWRNWVASEDELGLLRWEGIFGQGFHGAFIFVYDVCGERLPLPEERLFKTNGRRYAFFFIPLIIYRTFARTLSTKWETESMSATLFQKYAVPLDEFLGAEFCSR